MVYPLGVPPCLDPLDLGGRWRVVWALTYGFGFWFHVRCGVVDGRPCCLCCFLLRTLSVLLLPCFQVLSLAVVAVLYQFVSVHHLYFFGVLQECGRMLFVCALMVVALGGAQTRVVNSGSLGGKLWKLVFFILPLPALFHVLSCPL